MLTDFATLFAPPGRASAHLVVEPGGQDVLVYCAQPVDFRATKARGGATARADLQNALRSRGGIMVSLAGTGESAVNVEVVEKQSYEGPRQCLVLSPGGNSAFRPLKEIAGRPLEYGEHVVVPVDADSEQKLREFHSFLEYLPSDRALLIMHLIRRPSLEWRVSELERLSGASPAAAPRKRIAGVGGAEWWDRLRPHALAIALAAATIVLAVLLYFVGGSLLALVGICGKSPERATNEAKPNGNADHQPRAAESTTALPAGGEPSANPQADYDAATKSFINALAQRTTGPLHTIYVSHYEKAGLAPKETFAWALLKTELVKEKLLKENDPALKGLSQPQMDAVRELTKTVPFEAPASRMLAVASCDAWKTPSPQGLDHRDFGGASCEDVLKNREAATSAVLALTRWVGTLAPPQPR